MASSLPFTCLLYCTHSSGLDQEVTACYRCYIYNFLPGYDAYLIRKTGLSIFLSYLGWKAENTDVWIIDTDTFRVPRQFLACKLGIPFAILDCCLDLGTVEG